MLHGNGLVGIIVVAKEVNSKTRFTACVKIRWLVLLLLLKGCGGLMRLVTKSQCICIEANYPANTTDMNALTFFMGGDYEA